MVRAIRNSARSVSKQRQKLIWCMFTGARGLQAKTSKHKFVVVTRFIIDDFLRNYTENAKHVIYLSIFGFFNLVNSMA